MTKGKNLLRKIKRDKYLIFMVLPVVIYFLIFSYFPLYGVTIAFKDYSISRGILGSPWAGTKYFQQFFFSPYFPRLIRNTLLISVYSLLWGFPIPILFAVALNEFKKGKFKSVVQTVSYLPHFVSMVVICGILINILSPQGGVINSFLGKLTGKTYNFLGEPSYFRSIYVGSGIWQEFGWDSIIYMAAITGITEDLYEAAKIDGAGRLKQIWYITLPGIKSTIITILILSLGNMMSVGYEKIILLYSPSTYETADVISSYVYRMGLLNQRYSYGGAVGLFNSVINIVILCACNVVGKKVFEVGIW